MNNKQRRQIATAATQEESQIYDPTDDATSPVPSTDSPHGLQSRDCLDVLASSADVLDIDPNTNAFILVGERTVGGRAELRVEYRQDDQPGEPFTAVSGSATQRYTTAARHIGKIMGELGLRSYEIAPFTPTARKGGEPYQLPNAEAVVAFKTALDEKLREYLS